MLLSCLAHHRIMRTDMFLIYISCSSISFNWCLDDWHKDNEDNLIIFSTVTGEKWGKVFLDSCFLISEENLGKVLDRGIQMLKD
jgi:hypothetical protein